MAEQVTIDKLKAIINSEINNSIGFMGSNLTSQRKKSMELLSGQLPNDNEENYNDNENDNENDEENYNESVNENDNDICIHTNNNNTLSIT